MRICRAQRRGAGEESEEREGASNDERERTKARACLTQDDCDEIPDKAKVISDGDPF